MELISLSQGMKLWNIQFVKAIQLFIVLRLQYDVASDYGRIWFVLFKLNSIAERVYKSHPSTEEIQGFRSYYKHIPILLLKEIVENGNLRFIVKNLGLWVDIVIYGIYSIYAINPPLCWYGNNDLFQEDCLAWNSKFHSITRKYVSL